MQQLFIYGKRRRKVPDVSDVHLLGVVLVKDTAVRKKVVNAILIVIKPMPVLLWYRHKNHVIRT